MEASTRASELVDIKPVVGAAKMERLLLVPVIEQYGEAAAEGNNKLFCFSVGMSTSVFPARDIINPKCTFYFEGDMVFLFDKGEITSLVWDLGQFYDACVHDIKNSLEKINFGFKIPGRSLRFLPWSVYVFSIWKKCS